MDIKSSATAGVKVYLGGINILPNTTRCGLMLPDTTRQRQTANLISEALVPIKAVPLLRARQRPFLALDIFDNLQKIEGVDLEG